MQRSEKENIIIQFKLDLKREQQRWDDRLEEEIKEKDKRIMKLTDDL